MQYYSHLNNEFRTHCEFNLSDKIQELELPHRKCTSDIWRIIVFQKYISVDGKYFQDDSDDSETDISDATNNQHINDYLNQTNSDSNILNLHPRALVGCMRIDSHFSLKFIPSIEIALNIDNCFISLKSNLKINSNEKQSTMMPDFLQEYKQVETLNSVHTFLKIYLRNMRNQLIAYTGQAFTLNTELMLSSTICEFSYLTMQPLLEDFCLKFSVDQKINDADFTINIVSDDIVLRYGQSIGHTIAVMKQIWENTLNNSLFNTIITTNYIICNCTTIPFKFGQYLTEESVFLRSKESVFYSFRSDKFDQKLQFSLDAIQWTSDEPVHIMGGRTQAVRILSDKEYCIVKIEKISTTQRLITVKGQIEFLNMTTEFFRIQYRAFSSNKSDVISAIECELQPKHRISLFGQTDEVISQRFK